MQNKTETLAVGDRAPDFMLSAANREGVFSLSESRQRGPVILEFLRGTW
jgi:peroxiredoxin